MTFVLTYITWDVSPFIYEGEHFAISWYGTLWTLGLIGMLITLLVTFKHDGVPSQYALITFMVSLVCVIFFGHLFQGLFYEWDYLPDNPAHAFGTDWHYRNYYFEHPWKFFDFAHGGFASHGILLGTMLAAWILSKSWHCSYLWLAERACIALSIVGCCVRIGNLFNSEIYGIHTSVAWAFIYPGENMPSHPTQIYEALIFFLPYVIALILLLYTRCNRYYGLVFGITLITMFTLRFLVEFIKLPQMAIESNWLLNMGQWLSLPYILYGVYVVIVSIKNGPQEGKKPCVTLSDYGHKKRRKKQ